MIIKNIEYEVIPVGKSEDLRGQKFNKLIVLDRVKTARKGTYWACQCDCGELTVVSSTHLKSGHTSSCGCWKYEASFQDLTGKRFGRLTVLEYDFSDTHGHSYWKCQCDCGNIKSIRREGLVENTVVSCGCHKREQTIARNEQRALDLTNQRFGRLLALYPIDKCRWGYVLWHCKCDCGKEKNVLSTLLVKGNVRSCGCINFSIGENNIKTLLINNKISFEKEKTFIDLISNKNKKYRYDFYLPEYNRLIEFDGEQHYKYKGSGWNTKEHFEETQESDKVKNEHALSHNIDLVRIPYWERDNITLDMIIGNKYLIRKDN